jgi:hypothetical protein
VIAYDAGFQMSHTEVCELPPSYQVIHPTLAMSSLIANEIGHVHVLGQCHGTNTNCEGIWGRTIPGNGISP